MNFINEFVANYSESFRELIEFQGTGFGAEVNDRNRQFRREVIDYALQYPDLTSAILFRDLLLAEADHSDHAWSIIYTYQELAHHLLKYGGTQYLREFSHAICTNFDAVMATAGMDLSDIDDTDSLLKEFDRLIRSEEDESEKQSLLFGKERLLSDMEHGK